MVRGQNKTYEGPFRRTLFFLGILVGMRLILFGMLAFVGTLPVGTPWPVTEAETLAGGKIRLPDAAKGKRALVVMTFSKDAGEASKAWCNRFAKDFGIDRIYQIAMLEKAPRLVRGLIRRGLRGDMPASMQGRMLLIYKGEAEWSARLGVTNDAAPCLAMLDAEGRIAWFFQGNFDESVYQKLRQHAV